jgi:hypothetical protein
LILIAGSSNSETSPELLRYAHLLVKELVSKLLDSGARFLVQIGKEPIQPDTNLPLIFDWAVVSSVYDRLKGGINFYQKENSKPLVVLLKQDYEALIPQDRREIWDFLRGEGLLQLQFMPKGWSSGAVRRIRMSELGDILIGISGGEGVEHLAKEYSQRAKPVIPFDLELGSSSRDGSGGAPRLWGRMLEHPEPFFGIRDSKSIGGLIDGIATRNGTVSVEDVTTNTIVLIKAISSPFAFYVRLLNDESQDYKDVEWFYRNVVDKYVDQLGYSKIEIGNSKPNEAWINVDIFDGISKSELVLADLTGLRNNALIEFGFSLGLSKRTILMARIKTPLPFDTAMYDCYFWDPNKSVDTLLTELAEHVKKNIDRPHLVNYKEII